jgi:hypothetical protein
MSRDETPSAAACSTAGLSLGGRLAEVLLIVLVFFIFAGDAPPHNNEAHYLSRLKHDWNPAWGAGDLFLDSPEAHWVFTWAFGWVTRWLSLPATAWVGRLVAWTLLAWAWQRLSWRVVPVRLAAVLSATLWITLIRQGHLAGEWVVGGVEAKCFAYVFVLLALAALVDRHWNRVWLLLGAASALHVIVGGWCVVICGGIWLVDDRRRVSLPAMLPGLIGGGLLAMAGVLPALALAWNESREVVAEANRIYVFERLPHHLALLTLPQQEAIDRFLRHGLLIAALAVLHWSVRRTDKVSEDSDVGSRESGRESELDLPLAPRSSLLAPSSSLLAPRSFPLELFRFAWGSVLLAALGLLIEIVLWNRPEWAAELLRFYWFRLTDVAVPLTIALAIVWLIAWGTNRRRTWAVWALVAALILPGWQITSIVRHRFDNPVPPTDGRMRDFAAWEDVCRWVADNTPADALFLTPRHAASFKWRTGRAEVVTHKDIPQNARGIVEWHQRIKNIHYPDGTLEPVASLGELGAERLRALADEYGFEYVVTEQFPQLDLPIVYPNAANPNSEYVVYAIRRDDAQPKR